MTPIRKAIATAIIGLLPAAAQALCDGPPLSDRLSQAQLDAIDTAAAATPYGEGLIWQASRGDDRLLIVGTMHLPDPRHAALMARLGPELAGADLLLVEITPEGEAAMQAAMAADPSLMFLTEGPALPDLLDAGTWDALAEAARARQIPPFMAAKFQPWFLMVTLSIPPCAMDGLQSGGGLDKLLMTAASADGVPMQSLEPADTIFALFADAPLEDQLGLLRTALLPAAITEAVFAETLDSYFAGQVARLWEVSKTSLHFVPGLDPAEADRLMQMTEETLISDRNRNWIPVIEAAAGAHDTIVVAAGAAHLPGDNGLLRLLEGQGWAIALAP